MSQAIRDVGLEPYLINANHPDVIRATTYAYQKAKIPLLLGMDLNDSTTGIPNRIGRHAVAITGYRLEGDKTGFGGSNYYLRSSRINKIYAHDDQIGPFARMEFQTSSTELSTSWKNNKNEIGYITAQPIILLIPLYSKIRIPFDTIFKLIWELDRVFCKIDATLLFGISEIEWDIFLSKSNDFKQEMYKSGNNNCEKIHCLLTRLPKYIWRAIANLNGEKVELIFDTTDIEQGKVFLGLVKYSDSLFNLLKVVANNVNLSEIKSLQLRSILNEIRD